MRTIKMSELQEMLKSSKEILGDVEVFGWENSKENIETFDITGINNEGDHIELTN